MSSEEEFYHAKKQFYPGIRPLSDFMNNAGYNILNFRWVPSENRHVKETAEKMCTFFHCRLEDLFSRELMEILRNNQEIAGILQNRQTIYKEEVELEFLADYTSFQALPGPDDITHVEDKLVIDKVLNTLPPREQRIIRQRYFEDKTYEEIGRKEGITRERARQIERGTLRRLRHPCRTKGLVGEK